MPSVLLCPKVHLPQNLFPCSFNYCSNERSIPTHFSIVFLQGILPHVLWVPPAHCICAWILSLVLWVWLMDKEVFRVVERLVLATRFLTLLLRVKDSR